MRPAAFVLSMVVALIAVGLTATPANATDGIERVRLVPTDGGQVVIDGRIYEGPINIVTYQSGLGVVEVVPMDQYLLGIREVPFGWPTEALRSQVVAARTYAAWTLTRERSSTALRYDYDICATSRCQVYKGTADLESGLGERWRDAVAETSGEILVAGGAPAQALYSSSFGSASLGNQSVWGGAPVPYLQPVSSPEVGVAPFAMWTVVAREQQLLEILERDGYSVGAGLRTAVMDDGGGRDQASLVLTTADGATRVPATEVRSAFNRWGPRLYPESFPVVTPKGNVYPQTLLSYSFDVEMQPAPDATAPGLARIADLPTGASVLFFGEGWGHGVGMSQWGARIMAERGATYEQILGHYYGGLVPSAGGDLIPNPVRVGLVAGRPSLVLEIDGSVMLEVNGLPTGTMDHGVWVFHADGADVLHVVAPSSEAAAKLASAMWPR